MTKTILTILLILASAGALALEIKTKKEAYAHGVLDGHCLTVQRMVISAKEAKDPVVRRQVLDVVVGAIREFYPNIDIAVYLQACEMHLKLSERILTGKEV